MILKDNVKAWRICPREGCDHEAPIGHPCPSCGTPDRPDVHRLSDDGRGTWVTHHGRPIPAWCRVCGGPCDDRGDCPRAQYRGGDLDTSTVVRTINEGGSATMAFRVKCPRCDARQGKPCVSIWGTPTRTTHKARKIRAREVVLGKGAA